MSDELMFYELLRYVSSIFNQYWMKKNEKKEWKSVQNEKRAFRLSLSFLRYILFFSVLPIALLLLLFFIYLVISIKSLAFTHVVQHSESCVFDFSLYTSKYFIWTLGRVIHAVGDRCLSYRSSYSNRTKIRLFLKPLYV